MQKFFEAIIKYRIWSNVIIVIVFGLGLLSYMGVKKAFFPAFKPDIITVSVAYPGASPEEVEEGIVLKIEESLKGTTGIEEITSVSSENIGRVTVDILSDYDIDEMVTEVKNAVDRISAFPEGAEKPTVYKIEPTDRVAKLILQGDVDLKTLKYHAEQIEDDFWHRA